jgi:hypothetical protein
MEVQESWMAESCFLVRGGKVLGTISGWEIKGGTLLRISTRAVRELE